jgi:hypothetical protein
MAAALVKSDTPILKPGRLKGFLVVLPPRRDDVEDKGGTT